VEQVKSVHPHNLFLRQSNAFVAKRLLWGDGALRECSMLEPLYLGTRQP